MNAFERNLVNWMREQGKAVRVSDITRATPFRNFDYQEMKAVLEELAKKDEVHTLGAGWWRPGPKVDVLGAGLTSRDITLLTGGLDFENIQQIRSVVAVDIEVADWDGEAPTPVDTFLQGGGYTLRGIVVINDDLDGHRFMAILAD